MYAAAPVTCYEIRFQSLASEGHALSFPCDADGQVHLEELSESVRSKFMEAWDLVGREFAVPSVEVSGETH